MEAKFVVRLSDEERADLAALAARGRIAAGVRQRVLILLKADVEGPAWTDAEIAALLQVSLSTVHRVRQRCVDEGVEAAVFRKPSPQRLYRKLDGAQEAKLIALACSAPPAGRVSWTMQLLADRLVELEIIDSIGREAVRTTLKKTCSSGGSRSPGSKSSGSCLPNTTQSSSAPWRTCSMSTSGPTTRGGRSSRSTRRAGS
jgi:transposase